MVPYFVVPVTSSPRSWLSLKDPEFQTLFFRVVMLTMGAWFSSSVQV